MFTLTCQSKIIRELFTKTYFYCCKLFLFLLKNCMKFFSFTHCSAKKSTPPKLILDCPPMDQFKLANEWRSKISGSLATTPASDLYVGRGYKTLLERLHGNQELFIVSAGLGLVEKTKPIPSYDCTIAKGFKSSLENFVEGQVSLTQWWEDLSSSDFSDGKISNLKGTADFYLVGLTANYLQMVSQDLRETDAVKVIICGPKIQIPDLGSDVIRVPYTSAFDGPQCPIRGVKSDFVQRCHADFISRLVKYNDLTFALQSVLHDMQNWEEPHRLNNQSLDDVAILELILKHKCKFASMGKLHKFFRHELHIAGEQKRFSNLYKKVVKK